MNSTPILGMSLDEGLTWSEQFDGVPLKGMAGHFVSFLTFTRVCSVDRLKMTYYGSDTFLHTVKNLALRQLRTTRLLWVFRLQNSAIRTSQIWKLESHAAITSGRSTYWHRHLLVSNPFYSRGKCMEDPWRK